MAGNNSWADLIGQVIGENRPDIQSLANNPNVAAGIRQAWLASNPWKDFVPAGDLKNHVSPEQGAWVRQNYKGDIWTEPMPPGDENSISSSPPNPYLDWLVGNKTIAAIHTHPTSEANAGPSPADQNTRSGVPEIIQSRRGQYYLGAPVPSPPQEPLWQKVWRAL